jgi:glycerol uptake facilitator-like aquaporin
VTHVGVSLTFGLVVMAIIYAVGDVSGAHINPAVTLGFWALGRVSPRDLAGYLAAQLVGGVAGALAARVLVPGWESVGGAVTHPSVPVAAALALEFGMTALLLLLAFGFGSSDRLMRFTPLALVPFLTVVIWLGSPSTGASLNPARSAGPALAFADLDDLWLYFAAPAAAGLVVGLLWRRLSMPRPRMDGLCPVTPGGLDALLAQTPK